MQISTAANGTECIDLFEKNDYNIIFLDYRMPGLDGIETILELSKCFPDKFKRIPIISLTASAVSGDRERMLEAGFTDYLTKPVNVTDMENVLRKYLPKELQEKDSSFDDGANDNDEIKKLPEKLLSIKLLNPEKGIEYCGDAEDYTDALITYRDSIADRSKKLEDDISADDIDTFALDIHSLKSMSMAAGATSLAETALELETAAKASDCDKIKSLLPKFLDDYRSLLPLLNDAL